MKSQFTQFKKRLSFLSIALFVSISALIASVGNPVNAETINEVSASVTNQDDTAVEMKVRVHLRSADDSSIVLVEDRIWIVPLGKRFSGFLANMSVELNAERTDSIHLSLKAFLTTVGARPDSRSKKFNYELGLPARITGIQGKAGATYEITFIPNKFVELDPIDCQFDHREKGAFRIDPTANFDLHYVKNSLGDYHWNKMKEVLESEYRPFKKGFDINHPGKLHYYLYPCAVQTVAWDPRFGFAIDPTRSQSLGLYNHDYMAPAHIIATLTQVMRIYGYAPPFLAEGIAGYFYFFDFETLSAMRDSAIIPLKRLLSTQGYYTADPILATAEAGSFCRFLADKYGIDRFRRLYKESDDLTIVASFESVYQMSIEELESQWIDHLMILRPRKTQFVKRARLEAAGNNIDMAITIMQGALKWDTTFADTLVSISELATYYSETGKYELALRTYQSLYERAEGNNPKRAYYLLRVGYFQSLLGKFDMAGESYRILNEIDTNLVSVTEFNLARLQIFSGDTSGAIDRLKKLLETETDPVLLAEEGNALGMLLGAPGKHNDPDGALEAFERAVASATHVVKSSPSDGPSRFRLGLAYLGLGEHDLAHDYLILAKFLEFRPRYLGRELVALGQLADLQNDRTSALEYYNRADSLDNSVPGQSAAKLGIKKPFALKVAKSKRATDNK